MARIKSLSLILIFLMLCVWGFASIKWIGFKKANTVKVVTTSVDFISPTPTVSLAQTSTESAEKEATISSSPLPKVTKAPDSTSSSFVIASPSISVIRY